VLLGAVLVSSEAAGADSSHASLLECLENYTLDRNRTDKLPIVDSCQTIPGETIERCLATRQSEGLDAEAKRQLLHAAIRKGDYKAWFYLGALLHQEFGPDHDELAFCLMDEMARAAFRLRSDVIADPTTELSNEDVVVALAGLGSSAVYMANTAVYSLLREEDPAEARAPLRLEWSLADDFFGLDVERAREWLLQSAEMGFGPSQNSLSYLYRFGLGGFPMDAELAAQWEQRALEN